MTKKNGLKNYFKAFFYSGNNPQPVYFFIFVLFTLIVIMVTMRLLGLKHLSDTLILGMCGYVAVWAGIVTTRQHFGEKMRNGFGEHKEENNDDEQQTGGN
jgi:hypothetical protein